MDGITQCQIEIRRLRGVVREQQAEYAETLMALGDEYDKALELERAADTDTRRAFCAGMTEAYKTPWLFYQGTRRNHERFSIPVGHSHERRRRAVELPATYQAGPGH